MMCFHASQKGKHLLRTQNVSEQNQKNVWRPRQHSYQQQMLHARANGETFVLVTMCPRLPGPLENKIASTDNN